LGERIGWRDAALLMKDGERETGGCANLPCFMWSDFAMLIISPYRINLARCSTNVLDLSRREIFWMLIDILQSFIKASILAAKSLLPCECFQGIALNGCAVIPGTTTYPVCTTSMRRLMTNRWDGGMRCIGMCCTT